jgi:hypothetical protein
MALGKGPGRPKGSVNKLTADIREAIKQAFADVGGAEYLKMVAQTKPEVFCTLLGKAMPAEVNMTVSRRAEEMDDAELAAIAAGSGEDAVATPGYSQKPH